MNSIEALSTVNQLTSFSERGASLFVSESGEQLVLFKKLADDQYFQFGFTSDNYPSVSAGIIEITDSELLAHINDRCMGWYARKNDIGVALEDDYTVIGTVFDE